MKESNLKIILPTVSLAIILRILFLFHHNFWFDESFSFFVAKQNIPDLLAATAADNHPPFYYLLLHAWIKIFGSQEIILRFLSLIFGFSAIPIFYILAKENFGRMVANYSLISFALSPLMIYFSSEARMYSLLIFLTLLSVLFFLKLLKKYNPRMGFLFFLAFVLTLYTHYYAFLLFLPLLLLAKKTHSKKLLAILLISLIVTLPWIFEFFKYPHPQIFAQPTVTALPATFASFVLDGTGVVSLRNFFQESSPILSKTLFLTNFVTILILGLKGTIVAKKTRGGMETLQLLFLPLLFLTIANFFTPIFSVRSTILLAPFFFLLVGLGIKSLPPRLGFISLGIVSFLLLGSLYSLFVNQEFRGPPIKRAMEVTPQGFLTLHTSILTYYPFLYYGEDPQKNILVTPNPLSPKTVEIIGGEREDLLQDKEEFIILETTAGADPQEIATLRNFIKENYKLVEGKTLGELKIERFQKNRKDPTF